MKIIDLKKDNIFVTQYVELRNSYADILLTCSVDIDRTKEWLDKDDIEIRCLIEGDLLLGVVILYLLDRKGQIAFFVRYPNRGIGSKLLSVIETVARLKNLEIVWAWVLSSNLIAQRVFVKNGYVKGKETKRVHNHNTYKGIIFTKELSN